MLACPCGNLMMVWFLSVFRYTDRNDGLTVAVPDTSIYILGKPADTFPDKQFLVHRATIGSGHQSRIAPLIVGCLNNPEVVEPRAFFCDYSSPS